MWREIVIKIPEGLKDVFENRNVTALDVEEMRMAIKNGTPLPKEHGRLKDADKLYNIFNELCDEYNIDNMSFISEMNMNFDLAQTIIEANKGE